MWVMSIVNSHAPVLIVRGDWSLFDFSLGLTQ
jgi:hypothetical protein